MPRQKPIPVQRQPVADDEAGEGLSLGAGAGERGNGTETLVARVGRAGEATAVDAYAAARVQQQPIDVDEDEEEEEEGEEGEEGEEDDEPTEPVVPTPVPVPAPKSQSQSSSAAALLANSNLPPAPSINNFLAQLHAERAARMSANGGSAASTKPAPSVSVSRDVPKARIATLASRLAGGSDDDEEEGPRASSSKPSKSSKRSRASINYTESNEFEDPEDGDYDVNRDGTMADEDIPKPRKQARKFAGAGTTLSGAKPKRATAPAKKKQHEVLDFDPEWTSMPQGAFVLVKRQDELKKAVELAGDRIVVALYTVKRGAECRDMGEHLTQLAVSSANSTSSSSSSSSTPHTLAGSSSKPYQPPVFLKIDHDATPAMSHAYRVSHFPTVCFWHKGRMAGERVVGWNGGSGGRDAEEWIRRLAKGL